jgi:hypothetical protein
LASAFIYRYSACLSVGVILSQRPLPVSRSSRFFDFVLSLSILVFFLRFNPRYSSIIIFGPGLSSFYMDYYAAAWPTKFHHGQRTFCMV